MLAAMFSSLEARDSLYFLWWSFYYSLTLFRFIVLIYYACIQFPLHFSCWCYTFVAYWKSRTVRRFHSTPHAIARRDQMRLEL